MNNTTPKYRLISKHLTLLLGCKINVFLDKVKAAVDIKCMTEQGERSV